MAKENTVKLFNFQQAPSLGDLRTGVNGIRTNTIVGGFGSPIPTRNHSNPPAGSVTMPQTGSSLGHRPKRLTGESP